MPADLKELSTVIATYERLMSELSAFEKNFSPITDQMVTLAKFEVEVSSDMVTRHENIPVLWNDYLLLLEEAKKALEANKDKFKAELLEQAEEFKEAAKEFCDDFYKSAPCSSDVSGKDAMAQLKAFREQLEALRAQEAAIRDGLAVFNLTTPVNLDLQKMEKELEKLEEVWGLVFQWEDSWDRYKNQTFWEMETDEMEENVMFLFRNFNRLSRQLKDKGWDIIDTTRVKVDAFRRTLPLIGDLKNPCMRERHWDRIKTLMGVDFDQNSEDFKLELIMRLNFQAYAEDIAEISNAATMELNIENGLKAIREVWKNTTYEMQHHRGDMYKIKNVEEVMQFLEDHQVQLSSMKSTKYVEPFIKEVDYWEKSLGYVAECIEIALQVQRRYLYLESIFSGEDIRKQLPNEVKIFDKLTDDWTDITFNMHAGENAVAACIYKPLPYVFNKLNDMVDNLDGILRALEKYLETKRQLFPRFYFISNDDMLEILGNSKRPQLIQVHLKKLFDNVNKIRIDKREVLKVLEEKNRFIEKKNKCDNNLYKIQRNRYNTFFHSRMGKRNYIEMFTVACHKAIYSHDWDKLAYLLKKFPRWKFPDVISGNFDYIYTRALTLLLMYHPSSQSQGLLCEYLHMTWGCRSDEEKMAIIKVLLTLPKRLLKPYFVLMKADPGDKKEIDSD